MAKKRKKGGAVEPPEKPKWQSNSFDEAAWLMCLAGQDFYSIQCSFQGLILDGCPTITDRKVYLYDIACARQVLPLCANELLRQTIELAEEAADGPDGLTTRFLSTYGPVHEALAEYGPPPECLPLPPLDDLTRAAMELTAALAHTEDLGSRVRWMGTAYYVAAVASGDPDSNPIADMQVSLFRDIFDNVFRSASINRPWRTSTVHALARQMYESRDFSAMPILADTLQDAGCDNPDILAHCRDANQVHVRGCWVVDLVLGKT